MHGCKVLGLIPYGVKNETLKGEMELFGRTEFYIAVSFSY